MSSRIVQFRPLGGTSPALDLPADASLRERIIAILRTIYDPELPVNIYDLGLVYDVRIDEQDRVEIDMTLTAPGCPVAGSLPQLVERTLRTHVPLQDVQVTLVWDPPWSKERLSDEARLELDMF